MKILIVEDNPDSRLVLKTNLEGAGHKVIEAVHGEDALEKARASLPDMIISDILMPVMDGYKLCYEVKHDERLRWIPFVFYTATYIDLEDERLAFGLGASRFILKPTEPEEFLHIIEGLIDEVNRGELPVFDETIDEPLNLFRKFDASLSRKLEEKVRELELYRRVFDNSIEAIAVVRTDGYIARQNPSHRNLLGYGDEELCGKTPEIYLPDDEMTAIAEKLSHDGVAAGETRATPKDGSKICIDYSIFPVKDERNEVVFTIWMLRDITKRKDVEEKLRQAQEEWDKTFDAISDAVLLLKPDHSIIRANRAACMMFDRPLDEIIGKRCHELFAGMETPCDSCPFPAALETFVPCTTEIHQPHLNKTFLVSAVPIGGDKGNVESVAYFARDITEQKMLEAQYRQAQKMEAVGRLSGGVAHDFNNVLTTILGYSELLMGQFPEKSKIKEDLQEIHRAGERASVLTRQLLAFSRKQILEMRVLDFNEILDNLAKMLRRLLSENIDLQIVFKTEKPQVYADSGQLEQVIMNLVVNAGDAMPEGGVLLLRTETLEVDESFAKTHPELQIGPHLVLTVADTGFGIAAEHLDKIFEPFFTTKELGKGTGLGLATVYGIISQHQGTVTVYSEEGEGTTFKIYLPLTDKSATAQPTQGGKVDQLYQGQETILVVDDDELVRKMLNSMLNRLGYTVLLAKNGDDAIRVFNAYGKPVHLLLTDVVMPGMSGLSLAQVIRQKDPGIQIALMSGYADEIVRMKELAGPGYHFIEKPVVPSILAHKLRAIFDERKA